MRRLTPQSPVIILQSQTQVVSSYLSINAKAYPSKPSHNPAVTNPGRVQLSLDKCEGLVPGLLFKAYSHNRVVTNPDRVQVSLDKCKGLLLKAHSHNRAVTNPGRVQDSISRLVRMRRTHHVPTYSSKPHEIFSQLLCAVCCSILAD